MVEEVMRLRGGWSRKAAESSVQGVSGCGAVGFPVTARPERTFHVEGWARARPPRTGERGSVVAAAFRMPDVVRRTRPAIGAQRSTTSKRSG